MGKKIQNVHTSVSAPNKCALALLSLMREPLLKAQAGFMHGYLSLVLDEQYVFYGH